MATIRFQVSLQDKSGMARDQYVNSIYHTSPNGTATDFDAICSAIAAFYYGIGVYLSPTVASAGHTVKCYLVGAPLETPPFKTTTFSIPATTGAALPYDVASCLSFRAALHPGWQRQSTRGRIYLGPLNNSASAASPNQGRVGSAFMDAATSGAATLAGVLNAGPGGWSIYSKLHGEGSPVIEVSMDNEYDTVRSRGHRADAKTVLAITGGA